MYSIPIAVPDSIFWSEQVSDAYPYTKDGSRLVGQVAKRQAVTNPENTVYSIKRFMGRRFDEVTEEIKQVPFKVEKASNGDVRIDAERKPYIPPEIAAMILQKLKQSAEEPQERESLRQTIRKIFGLR